MRGEYSIAFPIRSITPELPPRARRIPHFGGRHEIFAGTTSACAENTPRTRQQPRHDRNYLRVRGEYTFEKMNRADQLELPPRARRILTYSFNYFGSAGTTSACAENTRRFIAAPRVQGNYLRVRGEYPGSFRQSWYQRELPPRARRILYGTGKTVPTCGTTSACAENTGCYLLGKL